MRGKTVVSYCTGGIRCEKAALFMQAAGVANVLQLEGGILKYFEDTGGAAPGWRGACFVFDEREVLGASLAPLVRAELGLSAEQMPLACVLEGGTWATGRVLAQELRGGAPPLNIASDGTVF